jgi:hypothetical protein
MKYTHRRLTRKEKIEIEKLYRRGFRLEKIPSLTHLAIQYGFKPAKKGIKLQPLTRTSPTTSVIQREINRLKKNKDATAERKESKDFIRAIEIKSVIREAGYKYRFTHEEKLAKEIEEGSPA